MRDRFSAESARSTCAALALGIALLASAACSDGVNTRDNTKSDLLPLSAVSLPVAEGPVAAAGGGSSSASPYAPVGAPSPQGSPSAVAVPMPPSTRCAIYPEGASNDPSRNETAYAGADGEVRFYLHPQANPGWGTRLTLDCTLNGSPQGHYLVDLNDSSTFKAEGRSELEPRIVGTRPALTGDLSSFGPSDLIPKGYPPRPDPVQNPEKYAQWVKSVTKPMDLYNTMPVTLLGAKATVGQYEGSYSASGFSVNPGNNPWSGFVQSAEGFQTLPHYGNFLFANSGVLYEEYSVQMLAPGAYGCSGACAGTAMWAGIGGWPANFFGAGVLTPDLMQSGFQTIPYGGGPVVELFAEWVTQNLVGAPEVWPPPGNDKFAPGDNFWILGFAGDQNCNLSNSPSLGCFIYLDETNNWGQYQTAPLPEGSLWWPSTTEYVSERLTAGMNENYFFNEMTGVGVDSAGTAHSDPGNASGNGDPYIAVYQLDSLGNPVTVRPAAS
jgi:hypothetical protein